MTHFASSTALSWYWLWHPLAGPGYQFWSGIASDIGEVTLIGGLIAIYRSKNCHAHRCWRIGKHHVDGTPYVVCKRHHPDVPDKPTADRIARAHMKAKERT